MGVQTFSYKKRRRRNRETKKKTKKKSAWESRSALSTLRDRASSLGVVVASLARDALLGVERDRQVLEIIRERPGERTRDAVAKALADASAVEAADEDEVGGAGGGGEIARGVRAQVAYQFAALNKR